MTLHQIAKSIQEEFQKVEYHINSWSLLQVDMRLGFEGKIDKLCLHLQCILQVNELKLSSHVLVTFKASFYLLIFSKVKNSKQASIQKHHLRLIYVQTNQILLLPTHQSYDLHAWYHLNLEDFK